MTPETVLLLIINRKLFLSGIISKETKEKIDKEILGDCISDNHYSGNDAIDPENELLISDRN